jgi:hypothetical protein
MGGQRHHRAEVYTIHRQFVTPRTDSVPSSNQRAHGAPAIGRAPYLGELCRKIAFSRQNPKIVYWKINGLRDQTFLFSVICDRALRCASGPAMCAASVRRGPGLPPVLRRDKV